jgi:hypothetical protein
VRLLIAAIAVAVPALALGAATLGGDPQSTPYICNTAVDETLVKVEIHTPNTDAVELKTGCTGVIHRLEVDTWTNDGVKLKAGGPHDLVIESGYITCHDSVDGAHQDGIQAMVGSNVTFEGLTIRCGLSNAEFFVSDDLAHGVVCDGCNLGPGASHTANVWGDDNGVRNSVLCKPQTSRYFTKHGTPIDVGNERAPAGDPRC